VLLSNIGLINAGFIATSYATEQHRGKYIALTSAALGIGSAVGSGTSLPVMRALGEEQIPTDFWTGIVLALTVHISKKSRHVPASVYITIISIQSVGFIISSLIQSPDRVRRADGQPIARLKLTRWKEEIIALPRSLLDRSVILMSVALLSCQMNFSLTGS